MKRKIFLITSVVFIVAVFVSICFGFIVPSFKSNGTTSGTSSGSTINRNYENSTNDEDDKKQETGEPVVQPDKNTNNNSNAGNITEPAKEELDFFVYDRLVTKTKEICGAATTFEVQFRLFVTNNTGSTKSILANAFSGDYAIDEYGLYYTFECNETQKSLVLQANETVDLDFAIKYIITDTENFNDLSKYDLVLNYMQKEIISLSV